MWFYFFDAIANPYPANAEQQKINFTWLAASAIDNEMRSLIIGYLIHFKSHTLERKLNLLLQILTFALVTVVSVTCVTAQVSSENVTVI